MIEQEIREVSARELARLVGVSRNAIVRDLEHVRGARRTDGGQWRVPLWAWREYQANRGAR